VPSKTGMPLKARLFISTVICLGFALVGFEMSRWHSIDVPRFVCFSVLSVAAAVLKVHLPGITGTMSVNFVFILIGTIDLSLPETLIMGCLGTLVQVLWRATKRCRPEQVLFSVASMAVAIKTCNVIYHSSFGPQFGIHGPLLLVMATSAFFFANTLPIAAVICLTERKVFHRIWYECYFWCFPYYLVGAVVAWVISVLSKSTDWQIAVLVVPVIYFIHRSYKLYLGRLEDEKKHVEDMAGLHLRTIEALALAIEAKDDTTHDHLLRVRTYALEIGVEMNLSEPDLNALRAASLLHDIGKLAVPEHIISKPGKLTPEEFEKMKIHPVVGAEILEQVQFPYPVEPIVRAHHEKWDGSGYPAGLKGEEIPIGARILAAVDCLDALASDRQYRRAVPLDEAMNIVEAESGRSFDPAVIAILKSRYVELERKAHMAPHPAAKLSKDLKILRGEAPAAGFERNDREPTAVASPLSSIAAARQEVQMLFELTQDVGSSLSLHETLSVVASRLKRLVPYDAIAVYVRREDTLLPEFVSGENFRLFSSLEIPMGEGLSGWVAENGKAIVNGNPTVEAGYLNDPTKFSTMRSALAVPLEGVSGVLGVLALYSAERDCFSKDHLRILLALSSKLGLAIENALKYRQIENSATTDYLTNLPNARSLFMRLDTEVARCSRTNQSLAVLVCDLDGFKQVNDRFGHIEGNRILRLVANGLSEHCRPYDYVARMGGDEFVLLLAEITPEVIGERIRSFQEVVAESGGTKMRGVLGLSVGIAWYPHDGREPEALLAQADRRMYKAKQEQKTRRRPPLAILKQPVIAGIAVR
jgi:diguanylate cyclase (GGDEF)-like protein/putative nucleotidyltransferase with HDIG domain